jgi:hypothetical protein
MRSPNWSIPSVAGALQAPLATHTLAFVPALTRIGAATTVLRAVAVGLLVVVRHMVIDDGRLIRAWLRNVKGAPEPPFALVVAVDQSFHLLCLTGAALVAAA